MTDTVFAFILGMLALGLIVNVYDRWNMLRNRVTYFNVDLDRMSSEDRIEFEQCARRMTAIAERYTEEVGGLE